MTGTQMVWCVTCRRYGTTDRHRCGNVAYGRCNTSNRFRAKRKTVQS